MADIRPAVVSARRTLAPFFNGPLILFIFPVKQVEFSLIGVQMAVAPVSAGRYAVKKIHAPFHSLQYICRSSHSHQIRWLLQWEMRHRHIQNMVHLLVALSHCQSADGISVQIQFGNLLCMLNTDIVKNRSLIDAEQHLMTIDGVLLLI